MNNIGRRYELIEHTADIGIRAKGRDLEHLFANAAWAMFDLLAELDSVQIRQSEQISLAAPNIEELFLVWLSELLYRYSSREIIYKEFAIKKLTSSSLSAEVKGEGFDLKRHRLKSEIKGVTYHQLKVQKVKGIWQGEVIFDV
ncbi:archease [Candidatus Omnitrophota bacterium]